MDGFKNTTKMKYMGAGGMVDGYSMGGYAKGGNAKPMMKGGDAKPMMAKGGNAKAGAKISKVMGEFKKGDLHSGSKDGPKVKSPKQAMAIALSEAGKGKMPMKKGGGGDVKVGKMPPLGESVKSGNRVSKMTAAEMREMEERFGNKRRPSPGDSVKSGNRIAKEEADEARHLGVFKKGGKVRKYAEGGPVEAVRNPRFMPIELPIELPIEPAMLPSRSQVSTEGMTPEQFLKFQYEQERAIHSDPSSPFHSMYFPSVAPPLMMEQPTPSPMQKIYEPRRPPGMLPPTAQMPMAGPGGNRDFYDRQVSPEQRARNEASMADGSYAAYYQQATGQPLPQQQMMELPKGVGAAPGVGARGGLLGALNNPRIREDLQQAMMQPQAPMGMAPVEPRNVTMMRHGGRAAMPKRGR